MLAKLRKQTLKGNNLFKKTQNNYFFGNKILLYLNYTDLMNK